jgi:hypothetical protein
MKHNEFSQEQNQTPASAPQPTSAADLTQNEFDFAPSLAARNDRNDAFSANIESPVLLLP